MIRLATGITPNYVSRATPYIRSLALYSNIEPVLFAVDFPPNSMHPGLGTIPVDYSKATVRLPKFMLQHGGFVQFAPDTWLDTDVIIFTDADAVLQRPFSPDELSLFGSVGDNEMLAGYNWPNLEENLMQEAANIFPKVPLERVAIKFSGCANMKCRNWGFVVGRLSAWKELFRRTVLLWPDCNACFENPARVQFMCCYAAQSAGMALHDLPATIHSHGHCGLKHGLTRDDGGIWYQDGEVVAFAHAL